MLARASPIPTGRFIDNKIQICIAIKRIYVHEDIYDAFRDATVAYAKSLVVGDGSNEANSLGPVQNSMQFEKVKKFFDDIHTENLNVAFGGKNEKTKGYFINPTIIDNPPEKSRIVTEEPFGTLLLWYNTQPVTDILIRA